MAGKTVLKPIYLDPQSLARIRSIRANGRGYESKEDFIKKCNKASESLASLVLHEKVKDTEIKNIQRIINDYKSLVSGLMPETRKESEPEETTEE